MFQESIVLELIEEVSAGYRMGIHNLYPLLKPRLIELGIKMGRTKVQSIRNAYGLTIRRRKHKVRTTNSYHHFHKWPYLLEGLEVESSEMLWVSDITYIRINSGFCFLSLVTDAYSRKVVGYHLCENLSTSGCLKAIEMALASRTYVDRPLIHHSDRGIQYCSGAYIEVLKEAGVEISMCRKGEVLDNAIAERMNGILKSCYEFDRIFSDIHSARIALDAAIYHYNFIKPHASVEWLRPAEAHKRTGKLRRKWK